MPEKNLASCNVLIVGYGRIGDGCEAVRLFEEIPERDVVSWTGMAAAYIQSGYVEKALDIFSRMPIRDEVSWNMMSGFVQYGQIEEALKFFEIMPVRGAMSWNAMIAGCAQNGRFDKALELFQQMRLFGVKPHPDTFASLLPACANLVALEQGKAVHVYIIKSGYHWNTDVGNALVDLYAKCGSIEDAYKVFDKMARQKLVSWTVIITSCAIYGFEKDALKFFEKMELSGTIPDGVPFVGVLSACGHEGPVDDGWRYFDFMSRYYQILLVRQHYCYMVELLGRAGHLKDALDLINKMLVESDAAVWLSLLSGCRIHNNVELGEHVAEFVFELQPKNCCNLYAAFNIYAVAGKWDDIEKDRKNDERQGDKKESRM